MKSQHKKQLDEIERLTLLGCTIRELEECGYKTRMIYTVRKRISKASGQKDLQEVLNVSRFNIQDFSEETVGNYKFDELKDLKIEDVVTIKEEIC